MKKEKITKWKDPAVLADAVVLIGAASAITLSILDLLGILSLSWFESAMPKLILAFVSILALSLVLDRRVHAERFRREVLEEIQRLSSQALGEIDRVYSSRSELPPFAEVVQHAKAEVFIAGILFGYVALQQRDILQKKAEDGCTIKFLFPALGDNVVGNPMLEPLCATLGIPQSKAVIETSLRTLTDWAGNLPQSVRERVQIRATSTVPTHVAVLVDPSLSSGFIQLEMLPPKTDVSKRWLVRLSPGTGGGIYKTYAEAYERLWREATQLELSL